MVNIIAIISKIFETIPEYLFSFKFSKSNSDMFNTSKIQLAKITKYVIFILFIMLIFSFSVRSAKMTHNGSADL